MTNKSLKAGHYLRISPVILVVLYIWISIIPAIEKSASEEEWDRNFAGEIVDQFNLGQRAGVTWMGTEKEQIVMDVIRGRMSAAGEYDGVVYGGDSNTSDMEKVFRALRYIRYDKVMHRLYLDHDRCTTQE